MEVFKLLCSQPHFPMWGCDVSIKRYQQGFWQPSNTEAHEFKGVVGGWAVTGALHKHKTKQASKWWLYLVPCDPGTLLLRSTSAPVPRPPFLTIKPLNNNPRRDSVAVCDLPPWHQRLCKHSGGFCAAAFLRPHTCKEATLQLSNWLLKKVKSRRWSFT